MSLDGSAWTSLGVKGDTANIDIDLDGIGPVRYIKVGQALHYIHPDYPRLGFDLDGVEALNAGPETLTVPVDIKPGSCPNPLNIKSKGVLPVAVLGTDEFDVTGIDLASIRLEGISPIRSNVEDVSTPVVDRQDVCDCTTEVVDGFDDLTLKFDRQAIVAALDGVDDGDQVVLTLTGETLDRTPIEGQDCVVILKKGKK